MHLPMTLAAQERNKDAVPGSADRDSPSTCQIFGQIFGSDPLAGEMLVKVPSGSIEMLRFDETTVFTAVSFDASSNAAPIPLASEAVNGGDWICARTGADVSEKRAATVLVAARQNIQRQQREILAGWLSGGAFGTVIERKPMSKSLVMESHLGGNSKRVVVNTSEKTRFHRYNWDGAELNVTAPASWAQVRPGEWMYVEGSSSVDGMSLNAKLVIFGNLQAIAGTVGAINAVDETVRLNELITDEAVIVHINPAGLRLISPGPERSHHEDDMGAFVLQAIDFGDIREGDSVIVLGRQDESSATKIDGLTLIVNFGEPALQGLSQQVTWKLIPVSFGIP
jgi:hypothetical protein